MKWRVTYYKGENVIFSIDVKHLSDVIELCECLSKAGHKPQIFKLDKEGDGLLYGEFELL